MALTTDFAGIDPGSRTAGSKDYSRYRIVPARHPGRLAGTIFAAIVIIAVLYSIFTNPRWAGASLLNGSLPNQCSSV
jgi:polar amino acid transport system permease protein